jgi:predicted transcriptional regulator
MVTYPRFTFRLNDTLLRKLTQLSISRHRTKGQIIREAIEMYHRAHSTIVLTPIQSDNTPT